MVVAAIFVVVVVDVVCANDMAPRFECVCILEFGFKCFGHGKWYLNILRARHLLENKKHKMENVSQRVRKYFA